jgi:hypothetical protein
MTLECTAMFLRRSTHDVPAVLEITMSVTMAMLFTLY